MCRKGKVRGSALILTVVLTSLLAIVGVLFLMTTRVDRMATSATSQNKELDLAIDALVAKVSEQLIWDVPGTRLAGGRYPEYHDYPGPDDRWLASSEPYQAGAGAAARYFWRHVSDIFERFDPNAYDLPVGRIADYQDSSRMVQGLPADADGDGIADSLWVVVPGITTTKGRPVFAAVRVVDNGVTNVNTAFRFDPCDPDISRIDGTNLSQINLMALAERPDVLLTPAKKRANETALLVARANGVGLDPNNLAAYEGDVVWHYDGELALPYTPFDIADELELRNRFLLNQRDTYTRIERFGWTGSFLAATTLEVPIGLGGSGMTVGEWFDRAFIFDPVSVPDPGRLRRYDYRHIATTCSMDRIINPVGPIPGIGMPLERGKMVSVNTANLSQLRYALRMGILDADPTRSVMTADALAVQITANIIDYRDDDSSVTRVVDINGAPHYGFERPCIYISEVAAEANSVPPATYTSYAIELHKPYFEDDIPGPGTWRLRIGARTVPINWTGIQRFHVVQFEDARAPLGPVDFNDPDEKLYAAAVPGYTPPRLPADAIVQDVSSVAIGAGSTIELQRQVALPGGRSEWIPVDSYPGTIPAATGRWLSPDATLWSIQRDISLHKCIRRLWDTAAGADPSTLGKFNTYVDSSALGRIQVQAHPYLEPAVYGGKGFKNIGEIGMVFAGSGYDVPIKSTEANLRLDFKNVLFARLLNYLTVIDPADHGRDPNETRIKGRINVNTAPPFVLEQLPWIAPARVGVGPIVSQAVVAYRDKIAIPGGPDYRARPGGLGFRSIGELAWVAGVPGMPGMDYYATDGLDQRGFPDLTPLKFLGLLDGAKDDFEERDLIFQRISNLITVRSDVFTAYILVRIGADGPQRRVIAILDRSGVFPRSTAPYTTGKVKVRALHQVPDPW